MALQQTYGNVAEGNFPVGNQFSDADINSFVQANIGNPQAIADAAQQYGVSADRLSQATGYDAGTISNYFGNAGINMWGQPQQGVDVQPPANLPPQQPIYAPAAPQTVYQDEVRAPVTGGITSLTPQGATLAPPPPVLPIGTPLNLPPVAPEETKYGTITPYTTTQIRDYVSNVMGDATLSPWERTNKIMEAAQKAGISQGDLTAMYGKDVVDPYMKTYGTGIKDFINNTLAKDEGTTFNEIATIRDVARKYGIDAQEAAKYSGMNQAGVDTLFDAYDKGLANIAKGWDTSLKAAGSDAAAIAEADANRAKTALALQKQYNVTDEDLAKATGVDVKKVQSYLEPIKAAPQTIQSLVSDPTLTAVNVRDKIEELRKNPAISGIYGAALDKLAANVNKDYSGEYGGKKFDSMNPLAVSNVLAQLQAQQAAGTAQYYQGGAKEGKKGGFGSLDAMTEDMAKNLVAAGITDIRNVGQKTITIPGEITYDSEGNATQNPDRTETVIINKLTGEPLSKASNYSERTQGNSWSGTFKGKGNTGYNVQFDKSGNPIFYTTGASSSDMQDFAPILALASFIPGAAPFVAAINALYAADQGNWKGALLSSLGAAGPLAGMAGASADTVANIGTASKIANVANAIDQKNLLGAIMSGTSLASDKNLFGDSAFNPAAKVAGDFSTKDLLGGASIANALKTGDLTTLANVGAQMSGSQDAITAAKGLTLVNALKSNNPMAIAQAVQKMNTTQDVIGKAGGGLASLPGLIKNGNKNTLTDKTAFDGLNGNLVAKMLNQQPPAIRAAMLKKMTQAA